jgi:superfamily II RNA helicase
MVYRGLTLDRFQADAIAALQAGRSVLVCAPTGTGKTIVADWLVDRAMERGREVVYTAPIKALSNQKYRDFCRAHGEARVGLVTGDLVIRRDAPCRVMTTEILRNMLLQGEDLAHLDAVVIDEIHFLDDRERGTTWEELLIYLPASVPILGLSATLANARQFADWLSHVRGGRVEVVRETQRAVPLELHVASVDEGILSPAEFDQRHQRWERSGRPARPNRHVGRRPPRRGASTGHGDIFDLLAEAELLPYLYFAFSRKNTETYARSLSSRLRRPLLSPEETLASDAVLDAFAAGDAGGALEPELRSMYGKGVAFHHAGLHVGLKALVEELYERRLIKVLYCTSTFALGINMPARAAAFDSLRKYDGRGLRPLTTREFMQKAGRAGRRGMDEVGHVIIRVDHDEWPDTAPLVRAYQRAEPEPVRSSFGLSFNSVANLLHRNPPDRIREIVDKSFLAFHRRSEAARLEADAGRLLEQGGSRARKDAHRMANRAADQVNRCWDDFQRRVDLLKAIGYIAADGTFNAGGRVLMHVQIEEIFVTELVLAGVFEELPPPLVFGLLCAVNKEFGRDVRVRLKPRGEEARVIREVERVRYSKPLREAEHITGLESTWCPEMVGFGRMWAEGKSLAEISRYVESSADITGDLVGAFRRAKDLCGQLLAVWADDEARVKAMKGLLGSVGRDEVMVVD